MAVLPLCARLANGQDASCVPVKRKYYQQVVLINKSDIASYTINKTDFEAAEPTCAYNATITLKEGASGFRFTGAENGAIYFGRVNKSTSDLGLVQYIHEVQMLVVGSDENSKCIQEALHKSQLVAALQFTDGTVELFGLENGLSTGDVTYSPAENGGGAAIILSSNENAPEGSLPLVYVSGTPGQESEDFDSAFETPVA